MNWLAHAFLSKPNIEFRVGNILPDMVSIGELKQYSFLFQEGIDCHKKIDVFTDAHPIVRKSISRLPEHYKRYGGILTDVFFDHFLAKNWSNYSSISIRDFTENFYSGLQLIEADMPKEILNIFQRMLSGGIFESYGNLVGIKQTLQRIDLRLRKPANLPGAMGILENYYENYEAEFFEFFPELKEYIEPYISE